MAFRFRKSARDGGIAPRRRWLQFSLQTLLVLLTLLSVWLGMVANPALRQRRVVEKIKARGGIVAYDSNVAGWEPPLPAWLHDSPGMDFLFNVKGVQYWIGVGGPMTDEDLALIAELPKVEQVFCGYLYGPTFFEGGRNAFTGAPLSDQEISHYVSLRGTFCQVTDSGLAQLTKLPHLQRLLLYDSRISDAGLKYLHNIKSLEWVDVSNSNVSQAGVEKMEQAVPGCSVDW